MLCCCWWMTCLWLFLLYKLVDLLIRIHKRSGPSSAVNNILITGCDMGFGRITALRLDRKGFIVFAACLTEEGKESLVKASGSGRINAFLMDVRDTSSIEKAYKHVCDSLPKGTGLWGVVNNAGVMQRYLGPLEWLRREDYYHCCEVNIFGMAEVTRIFLPLLKITKGRIVNTSSIAGLVGFPGSAAYCISKFGVEGFSETVRPELKVFGIKLHIVEPGFHATNLMEKIQQFSQDAWNRLPQNLKEEYPVDYITRSNEVVDKTINPMLSKQLDDVVDCYEHALLAYFPRGRYLAGKDAKLVWWPLSNMPEWFVDFFFNLDPRKPKPKSCQK